tara:strand:+ start:31262 stop:31714 length:453 start_codon:yes stop_codon:yes gene_type:complete
MRYFVLFLLLVCSTTVYAKKTFVKECTQEEENISSFSLVFFNKAELINLGSCVGVATIKRGAHLDIVESCKEVVEDKVNLLGVLVLSKAEAIQIGQCLGVIQYINNKYHNEYTYNNGIYQCKKGMAAVKTIVKLSDSKVSKTMLRDSLCH